MVLRYVTFFAALISFASSVRGGEPVFVLQKVLIADSIEKVSALEPHHAGTAPAAVDGAPLLADAEFQDVIRPFIGKPITPALASNIANAIMGYVAAKKDRIVTVVTPVQNIQQGAIRYVVVPTTYNELQFRGQRWFSQDLLRGRLGLKPGDQVRLSDLDEAINWVNTNPFRQIKVMVNAPPENPGKADLTFAVLEHRPYRATLSADNTGNDLIGKHRFAAGLQFGNVLGRDHQANYQFLTTDKWEVYQGHAVDYRVPLPWRHFFQVSGSYIRSRPLIRGILLNEGENVSTDARYTIPLAAGESPRELYFGLNYKHGNNKVEFPGVGGLASTVDVFQAFAGYSMVRRDSQGAWMLSANLNASPGDFNSRNTDAAWQAAPRTYASASYVYGSLAIQRLQKLDHGFELFTRAMLQHSSSNLVPSEHLAIGGSNTVRGYEENIHTGENGWGLSNDLMAPAWRKPFRLGSKTFAPEIRLLAFLDMADVDYKRRDIGPTEAVFGALASTGVGARVSVANNFSLSFDYGWQLTHRAPVFPATKIPPLHSRGHLKVVLAF